MQHILLLARRNRVTVRVVEAPPEAALVRQHGDRWLLLVSSRLSTAERRTAAATLIHAIPLDRGLRFRSMAFARQGASQELRDRVDRERRRLRGPYWAALLTLVPDHMLRRWEAGAIALAEAAAEAGLHEVDLLERYRLERMARADLLHRGKSGIEDLLRSGALTRGTRPRGEVVPLRPAPARWPSYSDRVRAIQRAWEAREEDEGRRP